MLLLAGVCVMPVSASDDNIDGAVVPTGGSAIRGSLDGITNPDDVYRVALNAGDTVSIKLGGVPGTDFDLYLYAPTAKDIWRNTEVAWSENPGTSSESISYDVPTSGTYYVDVASWDSVGAYTLKIISPSHLSISADKSTVTYPTSVKITGTLSPAHTGATVKLLQRGVTSGSYETAATSSVGAGGKYQFVVTPQLNSYYQVSWAGDVDHESASSGTVRVSVRPALAFSASAAQLSLGEGVTLSGRVSPNHRYTSVTIQRKLSRGWSALKTIKLSSSSRFEWTYAPKSTGAYDVRFLFSGDDTHESNSSGTVRFTVSTQPSS